MNSEFLRYSCQIALPGFSVDSQQLLQDARGLIAGAGGLGCPAAQYLAGAGIGTLGIADFDTVSETNLHRQVLYGPADFGRKKAEVACERLQKHNPGIKLVPHDMRITSQNVMELLDGYDILVDGTDNFETRYLLNDAAVLSGIPVVYGAIYQFEGQAAVWNVKNDRGSSPNYRDLFPTVNAWQIPNCADGGVIPTLAGIIGCIQANEVIKYITKTGDLLAGKMLVFDAQTLQSRIIKIREQTQVHIRKLVETMAIQELSAEDLKAELANDTVKLIDVRTPEEREELSLGGENIPISEILNHVDDIAKNSKIVFYCATGKRSAEAAKIIKSKYPDANVFTLAGGTRLMNLDEADFKDL